MSSSHQQDSRPQQPCCCQNSNPRRESEPYFDPLLFSMLLITALAIGNAIITKQPQVTQPAAANTKTNNRQSTLSPTYRGNFGTQVEQVKQVD